jgi:multimeric flavodoxin WrbA
MKAIAINSSPLMDKGNTALILTPFLEGIREAGAEVEVFYTKKLHIQPCEGEFICWLKTPGECFLRDDMDMLLPKLAEAEIWVLATPVHGDLITGTLQNLLERCLPMLSPFLELRDGHLQNSVREGIKPGLNVLVSNCGLWEMDNFNLLLASMQSLSSHSNRRFAGALLRPHGSALKVMLDRGMPVNDVLEAAKEAGHQLVETGEMSSQTLATISRPLMPLEMYMQAMNQHFQQALAALSPA